MFVKIKAKSAKVAPRTLIVNQIPVYIIDRRDGFRLTVFNRNTLKIVSDVNFETFNDAYSFFINHYNTLGYVGVINGHGEGNVLVMLIDTNTQNKIVKKGEDEAYLEYTLSISLPSEKVKEMEKNVEKTRKEEKEKKAEETEEEQLPVEAKAFVVEKPFRDWRSIIPVLLAILIFLGVSKR